MSACIYVSSSQPVFFGHFFSGHFQICMNGFGRFGLKSCWNAVGHLTDTNSPPTFLKRLVQNSMQIWKLPEKCQSTGPIALTSVYLHGYLLHYFHLISFAVHYFYHHKLNAITSNGFHHQIETEQTHTHLLLCIHIKFAWLFFHFSRSCPLWNMLPINT